MSTHGNIARANSLYRSGAYREALALYEEIARHEKASWVHANITLCRKKIETSTDRSSKNLATASSPEIIVTLTTIRSRLHLVPKVLESLLLQTLRPTRIELNISREPYLLDEGIAPDDPILLELMKAPLLQINWVLNIGPYRKIWSFLESHFSQTGAKKRLFVTVDDDTLYPSYFLQQLYSSYLQYGCVIAFRGRHIEMVGENIAPYDQWTWGQVQPSHNNLPTGKDGIFYSTEFFTKDFLDLTEALRTAPTADDLWIKWHCSLNGVPAVVLNPEACSSDFKSFPLVSYEKADRNNSLYHAHNSPVSQNKNDIAIKELEAHFKTARGYNLAWLIRSPDAVYKKAGTPQLAKQNGSLPRLLFLEKSSGEASKVELDALAWQAQNKYRYAIASGITLETDGDFSPPSHGQVIAILEGVDYTPEIAETVIALMAELSAQKTLRYRLSLASSGDKVTSLPRVEFWLPGAETQARQLDALITDKDCAHMNSLKRLRQLLELQKPSDDRSIFLANQHRRNASASQGCELFKKKYLSNCHVLNLTHRIDRLKRVNHVFDAMGIQVNRVEAVHGKESRLCHEIFKKVTKEYEILANSDIAPFRWDFDMYQSYPSEEARNVHFAKTQGKLLSLGSLGYLLSYRKALVQGLCSATDDNNYITVFDDDVLLHSDWVKILEDVYWQLPENPAVIMLGAIQYNWDKGISWFSENLYCCNGSSIASHATVIHKEYAQFLIDEIEKFILPFDIGPLHYLKSRLFGRSFVIYPNVLIQETSESDIADTKKQKIIGQTRDNVYRWELEKYKVGLV